VANVPLTDLARLHAPLQSELRAAFERVLEASSFILGAEVERFERAFAELCGVRHCVGVASGTAALTIMIKAAGIKPGDEVIIPAHTFIASALAVVHAGARPVCVDVDDGTALIDPSAVQAAIGPRSAAILAVHLYGQACAMEPLRELAARHGLALLEDAAQAHGAMYLDRRVGSLGTAAAFSFYPSKNLGALGDGGAICTDDDDLAAYARRLRDLGRDGHSGHTVSGYNERLDGLQAALLAVKLPHLDAWTAARRALAAAYEDHLTDEVKLLGEAPESPCSYHLFPIRVDQRDELAAHLASQGIASGVHYPVAVPDQPALRGIDRRVDTPVARDWAARELSIPIFPGMRQDELEFVSEAIGSWNRHRLGSRAPRSRRSGITPYTS
jgi:dTDP-4-amino-4,6-dideoxygalactose transaminase